VVSLATGAAGTAALTRRLHVLNDEADYVVITTASVPGKRGSSVARRAPRDSWTRSSWRSMSRNLVPNARS
jgi:hypothetical protein